MMMVGIKAKTSSSYIRRVVLVHNDRLAGLTSSSFTSFFLVDGVASIDLEWLGIRTALTERGGDAPSEITLELEIWND